jgi:hypothetical protein
MTFKWKITTPPRIGRVDGVELSVPGIECDFETGSGSEAVGIFEAEDAAFTKIFGRSPLAAIDFSAVTGGVETPPPAAGDKPAPKPRGRPAKSTAEVVAPDPIPVGDAAKVGDQTPTTPAVAPAGPTAVAPLPTPPAVPAIPSPPIAAEPGPNGIPAFLDRTIAAPPPVPAGLPPLPTAPVAAPPPPVGVLGPKVVAALDERKKLGADGGQALADWLAASGLTIAGKNYDDACRAVLMISDEKLKAAGVPEALGLK